MWLRGWKYRLPVFYTPQQSEDEVRVTIDKYCETFWQHVKSDGTDIRVVDADGLTELPFLRESFDYANMSASIYTYPVPSGGGDRKRFFIYVGNASATDASDPSLVPTAPLSGTPVSALLLAFRKGGALVWDITTEKTFKAKKNSAPLMIISSTSALEPYHPGFRPEVAEVALTILDSSSVDQTATVLKDIEIHDIEIKFILKELTTAETYTFQVSLWFSDDSKIYAETTLTVE